MNSASTCWEMQLLPLPYNMYSSVKATQKSAFPFDAQLFIALVEAHQRPFPESNQIS